MRTHAWLTHLLVVCACFVSIAPAPTIAQPIQSTPTELPLIETPKPDDLVLGQVVRILDADTVLIRIDGSTRRYQLLGADAPEYVPADRTPEPYAVESRRFIENLLLDEYVYIQHDPNGQRDASKRWTAYLFRAPDMLFVNMELVRQGYARHNSRHVSIHTDAFAYYAQRAEQLKRGIWNPDPQPFKWQEAPPQTQEPDSAQPDEPQNPDPKPDPASTVYITKYGKSYHRKDCPHLTDTKRTATRDEVKSTHKPCKTCKPDEN